MPYNLTITLHQANDAFLTLAQYINQAVNQPQKQLLQATAADHSFITAASVHMCLDQQAHASQVAVGNVKFALNVQNGKSLELKCKRQITDNLPVLQ